MDRQLCRVIARSEVYIEQLEGIVSEQQEKIEEQQREIARLEGEVHTARHEGQEQAEQENEADELGITPKTRKAAEAEKKNVTKQVRGVREDQ
jgi:uncharacterized coiled-coil protein SlyX